MRLSPRPMPIVSAFVLVVCMVTGMAPQATAAAPPAVVSPAAGATVGYGAATTVVIDFLQAGYYSATLACGSGQGAVDALILYGSVPAGRQSIDLGELVAETEVGGGATCEVRIEPFLSAAPVTSTFAIAAPPPLDLGDLHSSKRTFYPLVKDGYLDDLDLWYETNRIAIGDSLTIKDAKGRTVLNETYDEPFIGRSEWPWDGKTRGGKPVLPGKYNVIISATALDGTAQTLSTTVRVNTKAVTRRKKVEISKGWKGDYSSRGDCRVRSNFGRDTAILDCQGGEFAAVTYGFKVPTDARKFRAGATIERTADDLYRGSITTLGTRISKRKYQVRVQATDQRSVEVFAAWISYIGTYQI